ncbi:hypothetical protein G9A89_013458 [Geosiphon pyriformis]|nr:hypothetical protein G9A89_013458 [Geosiphon pyriformis]
MTLLFAIFDWKTFKCWKRLDPCGPVLDWFSLSVLFINNVTSSPVCPSSLGDADGFLKFKSVCNQLSYVKTCCLFVYTDSSLKDLGILQRKAGAAVFFEDIGLDLGVEISGLLFFTLMKLQAIALALEYASPFSLICLYFDNQAALNAYKLELCLHIVDIIHYKNLRVEWLKVKDHSDVVRNKCVDVFVAVAFLFDWFFPFQLKRHCLLAGGNLISGNSSKSVHWVHWEVGSIWHPDLHMAVGFISKLSAGLYMYFMKALYYQLPVAVRNVLCLFCSDVEVFDHVFSCKIDFPSHCQLLNTYAAFWELISSLLYSSFCVFQLLLSCTSNVFVFTKWCLSFMILNLQVEELWILCMLLASASRIVSGWFIYSQQLGLNNNYFLAEFVFNFYINNKITDCLEGTVNIESARENFYTELFQHTSLPRNYSFAPIIKEINQIIERYTQQQFPITYVDKGKRRLQTPAVTPKQIQPSTWKKTRVELPTNPSYYYTPESAINISLTDPMAYAPIAKLEKFTDKEDDIQIWLNNIEKAIMTNG